MLALELHWPAAARLPRALQTAGFEVGVLCRPSAYLARTKFIDHVFPLPSESRGRAIFAHLVAAAQAWRPDLVLPMDDRSALFLAQAHAEASNRRDLLTLAQLLQTSLGKPANLPHAASKRATFEAAQRLGLRTPASRTITSTRELDEFAGTHGFPAVLKESFSNGGNGVFICGDEREARTTLTALLRTGGLRSYFRSWRAQLRGRTMSRRWLPADRSIIVSQFIAGKNATSLVAAFAGEPLAALTAEVVESYPNAKGPSSVVRFTDHEEMRHTSAALVRHWGLTGLIGFDFIVDADGAAWLLECNPRPTPIAHLGARAGIDLALALKQRIAGDTRPAPPPYKPGLTVAFFPFETWRDALSTHLQNSFHDIPTDDPELLASLTQATPWAHHSVVMSS